MPKPKTNSFFDSLYEYVQKNQDDRDDKNRSALQRELSSSAALGSLLGGLPGILMASSGLGIPGVIAAGTGSLLGGVGGTAYELPRARKKLKISSPDVVSREVERLSRDKYQGVPSHVMELLQELEAAGLSADLEGRKDPQITFNNRRN